MNPVQVSYIQQLVREYSANMLSDDKGYLIEMRLKPLAERHGYGTPQVLVDRLRADRHGTLHEEVVEALTINESYFFRDVTPFALLAERAIPELVERRQAERRLNIWSAACSTGQEPYSIAMLLLEEFPELAGWTIQVHASDLSRATIARAKDGVYSQHEVNRGLRPEYLAKYFERRGDEWRVREVVRRRVAFRHLNLAAPWPLLPQMDVIFLRNVMIYFDLSTKRRVLGCVERQLHADGFFFVGGAESPVLIYDGFCPEANQAAGCFRLRAGARPSPVS